MIMMCIYLNAMMHLPIGSVGLAYYAYLPTCWRMLGDFYEQM